jgi:hypothetical protein
VRSFDFMEWFYPGHCVLVDYVMNDSTLVMGCQVKRVKNVTFIGMGLHLVKVSEFFEVRDLNFGRGVVRQ